MHVVLSRVVWQHAGLIGPSRRLTSEENTPPTELKTHHLSYGSRVCSSHQLNIPSPTAGGRPRSGMSSAPSALGVWRSLFPE